MWDKNCLFEHELKEFRITCQLKRHLMMSHAFSILRKEIGRGAKQSLSSGRMDKIALAPMRRPALEKTVVIQEWRGLNELITEADATVSWYGLPPEEAADHAFGKNG